jgi:[ribosomal protein S18]-alanine N-acetyltransferase
MDSTPRRLPVRFRLATLADVPRVHEIDTLSFSMPWSERSYRFELTENNNSLILVAEVVPPGAPTELVGMIVIWVILDEAHIATVAVHPAYRGQGIGRCLLARGLSAAYERGARLAYLEVRRSNAVAQNMYERFGFQVVGQRPRYYQDNNEDALLMTLDPLQVEVLQQFID